MTIIEKLSEELVKALSESNLDFFELRFSKNAREARHLDDGILISIGIPDRQDTLVSFKENSSAKDAFASIREQARKLCDGYESLKTI